METIKIGKFTLTPEGILSYEGGEPQTLLERETGVLIYLYQHRNEVVKKEDLLLAVWGEDEFFKGRTADVYITRIRKLLIADPTVRIERIMSAGDKRGGWWYLGKLFRRKNKITISGFKLCCT